MGDGLRQTMNFADVDLVSLIKQVRLENEDKIAESTLDFRWSLPEEKCILSLDPQRTYRIIDNLIQNILKSLVKNIC
jgi:signal transduction histidine kinase